LIGRSGPLFPSGLALRKHRSSRLVLFGRRLKTTTDVARDYRRIGGAGAIGNPVREDDCGRSVSALSTESTSSTPTFRAAEGKHTRFSFVVAGFQRRPGDGRGRRPGSDRRRRSSRGSTRRHAAIKLIVAAIDEHGPGRGRQEKKLAVSEEGNCRATSTAKSKARFFRTAGEGDADSRQARRTTRSVETTPEGGSSPPSPETEAERRADAKAIFKELKEKVLREEVADARRPPRRPQVRRNPPDLDTRRACLPRTHGSAVFTRGETQAGFVTCTLGTDDDAQKIETFEGETWKELHPPLQLPAPSRSAKVGRMTGPGRREVGPRRAQPSARLRADAADRREVFPYTVRGRLGPSSSRTDRPSHGVGLRRLTGDDGRRRGR